LGQDEARCPSRCRAYATEPAGLEEACHDVPFGRSGGCKRHVCHCQSCRVCEQRGSCTMSARQQAEASLGFELIALAAKVGSGVSSGEGKARGVCVGAADGSGSQAVDHDNASHGRREYPKSVACRCGITSIRLAKLLRPSAYSTASSMMTQRRPGQRRSAQSSKSADGLLGRLPSNATPWLGLVGQWLNHMSRATAGMRS